MLLISSTKYTIKVVNKIGQDAYKQVSHLESMAIIHCLTRSPITSYPSVELHHVTLSIQDNT